MWRVARLAPILGATILVFLSCGSSNQDTEITVYGSPACSLCSELRAELEEREIPYEFVDLSESRQAVRELSLELADEAWFSGAIEMPIVEIAGELLRRPSIDRILAVQAP